MIHTASYFQKVNHFGKIYSVSLYTPKWVNCDRLEIFVPTQKLLSDWKKGMTHPEYVSVYREICRERLPQIKEWLDELKPEVDITLCCYEPRGSFCHRHLAYKFVEKYRPDCLGYNN